jgi:hypothetical protein
MAWRFGSRNFEHALAFAAKLLTDLGVVAGAAFDLGALLVDRTVDLVELSGLRRRANLACVRPSGTLIVAFELCQCILVDQCGDLGLTAAVALRLVGPMQLAGLVELRLKMLWSAAQHGG